MADELSGREFDKAVALAFGFKPRITWEILTADEGATMIGFDRESEARKWFDEHPYAQKDHHVGKWEHWPNFRESIEAAFKVQDRIAERGKQGDYIAALWDVIGADRSLNFWTASNTRAFWLCVHATPEQRCRAALVLMNRSKPE